LKLTRVVGLLACALPTWAQYAGPAILSRGEAPASMSAPEIRFRPYADFMAGWSSGLAGVQVSKPGELASASAYYMSLGWGVSGTHLWRHTKVGLDYNGSLQHNFRQSFYDSINQNILLSVTHQLSRRTTLTLAESAGMFTQLGRFVGMPDTVLFDPSTAYIPRTDFFDNRTFYVSSTAGLTMRKTARLSFSIAGIGFLTRRRSSALAGVVAVGAQGDMQYRLSRRSTVGFSYQYQRYKFTRVFGSSDAHLAAVSYSLGISQYLEFSAFAGGARIETSFLQTVPLDPVIAALLGINNTNLVSHQSQWGPALGGRLARRFRTGVAYVSAGHSITPGNGLFLTSFQTSIAGGYSYTGLRKWSCSIGAEHDRARSLGNIVGEYNTTTGNASASRQIYRMLHFVATYSARSYGSADYSGYNRIIQTVAVGIGFAPGDVPIRMW
jgi:hypothetical protein